MNSHATLGILGGMGPAAGVDLCRKIVDQHPASRDQDHIPFILYSVPQIPDRTEALLHDGASPLDGMLDGVHALDLASGEQRWLSPTGNPVTSSPVVVGKLVYIASGLNLYGLDITTGQSQWRFSATDTISASPAIANSQIYIGSQDGFMYAIGGDGRQ